MDKYRFSMWQIKQALLVAVKDRKAGEVLWMAVKFGQRVSTGGHWMRMSCVIPLVFEFMKDSNRLKINFSVSVSLSLSVSLPLSWLFLGRVLFCSSDCLGTYYVDEAGLKLMEIHLPLPPEHWHCSKQIRLRLIYLHQWSLQGKKN